MPFIVQPSDIGGGGEGTTRTLMELQVPGADYAVTCTVLCNTHGGFARAQIVVINATDDITIVGTTLVVGIDPSSGAEQTIALDLVGITSVPATANIEVRATWDNDHAFPPADSVDWLVSSNAFGQRFAYLQLLSDNASGIDLVLASVRQVYVNPWEDA